MIVLHNPHDTLSVEFVSYLEANNIPHCRLDWYTLPVSRDSKRAGELVLRLVSMYISGAMEGYAPPEPEIEFTDSDIENGTYPEEFDRWIMTCDCHKGQSYEGPPPRAFPSVIRELEDGSLGLWDLTVEIARGNVETLTPQQMYESITPQNMNCSVRRGECIAGMWVEGAKQFAQSPHYSNHLIRTAVARYIKKYQTIQLEEPDKVLVERKHESHSSI